MKTKEIESEAVKMLGLLVLSVGPHPKKTLHLFKLPSHNSQPRSWGVYYNVYSLTNLVVYNQVQKV